MSAVPAVHHTVFLMVKRDIYLSLMFT